MLDAAFDDADANSDGVLSFSEARTEVAGLTQAQFNAMDTNNSDTLTEAELRRVIGEDGGCAGTKSGSLSWPRDLGEWILGALGVATFALWSRFMSPGS